MKVLIVAGGDTAEREISLLSTKSVKKALEDKGFLAEVYDFKNLQSLLNISKNFALVFPLLHGKLGEDGKLYQSLVSQKIPYIGSDPKGAAIAFNKIKHKRYCKKRNIHTARWKKLPSYLTIEKLFGEIKEFGFPCVLKGSQGGSSREVVILLSKKNLNSREVKNILSLDDNFFIEEFIKGIEVTVGILGRKPLPVIEIVPPQNQWFNFKNKYSGQTKEIPFAPSISRKVQLLAQEIALNIHLDLNLGHYSRTDFIIRDNIPYLLETNTPAGVGMTSESLFPKAAQAAGITFPDLVEKLVNSAF